MDRDVNRSRADSTASGHRQSHRAARSQTIQHRLNRWQPQNTAPTNERQTPQSNIKGTQRTAPQSKSSAGSDGTETGNCFCRHVITRAHAQQRRGWIPRRFLLVGTTNYAAFSARAELVALRMSVTILLMSEGFVTLVSRSSSGLSLLMSKPLGEFDLK